MSFAKRVRQLIVTSCNHLIFISDPPLNPTVVPTWGGFAPQVFWDHYPVHQSLMLQIHWATESHTQAGSVPQLPHRQVGEEEVYPLTFCCVQSCVQKASHVRKACHYKTFRPRRTLWWKVTQKLLGPMLFPNEILTLGEAPWLGFVQFGWVVWL